VKIDLKELLREVGNETEIEMEERVSFPEDGLVLTKPVSIKAHLTNTGTLVLLDGTLETEAELDCSRCLKKFRFPLAASLSEEYSREPSPSEGKRGKGIELKEEDFVYPIAADSSIDFDEVIRQNLLLALPIKPLCSAACKGD